MLKEDDIINVKSWMSLGDCNYEIDHDDDSIPESGVVYCNIEHIHKLFAKCEQTDNEYVVVSGFSDYGIAHQAEHPVWLDMKKHLHLLTDFVTPELHYNSINVPARCELDKCDPDHKYSVRCYSYTYSTFPEIPKNIKKWFVVNAMIEHDVIQGIPLGIGKDSGPEFFKRFKEIDLSSKENYLYVNWQNYTLERAELKHFYLSHNPSWCTIRTEPLPFEEYLDEISRHAFVLCPAGNGIDCYRVLEAIYLGCVPVVEDSPTMRHLDGLPILRVPSLYNVDFSLLKNSIDSFNNYSLDKAKLSYWKDRIYGE